MLLLTLRGTPFLYYGDELGMPDTPVSPELARDSVALRFPQYPCRDRARTPMQWSAEPGAGFTAPGVTPWLPFGDLDQANVADQREDPSSTLHLCRDLIALRRREEDLRRGAYEQLETPDGLWAYRRGESTVVALNLTPQPARLDGVAGTIELGTDRSRDGDRVSGALTLRPHEGVVITDLEGR
jgi:alpha-glucosidase